MLVFYSDLRNQTKQNANNKEGMENKTEDQVPISPNPIEFHIFPIHYPELLRTFLTAGLE